MKLAGFIIGIIIGILLALSVKTVYANYERFSWVRHTSNVYVEVLWDDAEKTNCYVSSWGGISCIRSMNY